MKPNRAGREGSSFEGWCLPHLEANMGEEGEGRPFRERVWLFMNTYCNILWTTSHFALLMVSLWQNQKHRGYVPLK